MTKQSGLGAGLVIGGYDISGDIGSVQRIASPRGTTDVTGIDKSAYERLLTTKDGGIDFSAFFNKASGRAHPVLRSLPSTDVIATYMHRQTVGAPTANIVAKQTNYDGNRTQDGAFTFSVSTLGNAYGLEWGQLATDGVDSFTGAGNGTGFLIPGASNLVQGAGANGIASTPDAAALDIVGDIDIRAQIAANDWTPSADNYIVSKYTVTGNQRSYALILTTTGNLALQWSADGTTSISKNSTANLSALANGAKKWVRGTLDVDNGASGNTVTFYTSDDGVTWTQLGSAVVTATATAIFASTAVLELGSRNNGTSDYFSGRIYSAEVRSGIGGTAVASPVANGTTGFTDATGKVWTNYTNAINGADNRYGVQVYLNVISFTGTSAVVTLHGSLDNGVSDTYAITSSSLSSTITSAPYSVRLSVAEGTVAEQYQRVNVSGTFNEISFALSVVANEATGVTF